MPTGYCRNVEMDTRERNKYTTILLLHYSNSNYCEDLMKTTIKIPGTCTLRKIKDGISLPCFSFRNLQFFLLPLFIRSCTTEFLCVRIRAHDKNDLYSRACAKKLMVSSLLSLLIHTREEIRTGILYEMV